MPWRDDFESNSLWDQAIAVEGHLTSMVSDRRLDAANPLIEMLRELLARIIAQREDPQVTITARSLGLVADQLAAVGDALPDIRAVFAPSRLPGGRGGPPIFDEIANEVRTWPQSGKGKLTGLSSQVSSLDTLTTAALEQVQKRAFELEQVMHVLEREVKTTAARRADENERAAKATASRLDQIQHLGERIENNAQDQIARIDQAIRSHQDTFTQAEGQRADEAAVHANRREAEWQETVTSLQVQIDEHQMAMRNHEEQSRQVLAAIGVNSTATHYGSHAENQAGIAGRWRVIATIVFALAGLWFVASSIVPALHGDGALWEQAVSRLGITAAVAGVGLYAARESSQHRVQERRARHAQLVLTALEPFIANLDLEKAAQIRDEAARALFVSDPETKEPTTASDTDMVTLFREVLQRMPVPKGADA